MYLILLFSAVLIHIVICNELNHSNQGSEIKQSAAENRNVMIPHNASYIEKAENMIRMPTINPLEDKKKKFLKKSPKRTIQKIIKKKKQKTKRIYVIKLQTTTKTAHTYYDKGQDDLSAWKDDQTTLASNLRKKPKKYKLKGARNPTPFQKLQKKKFYKREKRGAVDREDVYILKDFDELKFLNTNKDFNVVQTHVKKYW
ncbi:unnamed protein product [Arctia plantaginis]|uniref:Uncharacterized protein n=1 Tax=Arctia plantaginis TaxID=874455 RepID=A0A8S1B4Z2_ARCPL|nr:unnamed protein product [Arctia plantaginis]